jgi:hypothetical protein
MNCLLAERFTTTTGRPEAAPVSPLVAWVRRHLPDAAVWPPQRGQGEKEPSSDAEERTRRQVKVLILPTLVLQLGADRFGPPSADVRAAIEAVTDIEQLETLAARLPDVESWDELLAG